MMTLAELVRRVFFVCEIVLVYGAVVSTRDWKTADYANERRFLGSILAS